MTTTRNCTCRKCGKDYQAPVEGQHRLLCGDSTREADMARLMDGAVAGMVFTDPPYNVDYANSAKDKLRGKDRPILNDNLGGDFHAFLLAALGQMLRHCGGAVYVAMSSSELDTLQSAFREAGGHWSTFIIWAKSTFTMGRSDYQRQYEAILYGWPEGGKRHWCGARDQGDVWQIKKPHRNDLHPTMKPVELVSRASRCARRPKCAAGQFLVGQRETGAKPMRSGAAGRATSGWRRATSGVTGRLSPR